MYEKTTVPVTSVIAHTDEVVNIIMWDESKRTLTQLNNEVNKSVEI